MSLTSQNTQTIKKGYKRTEIGAIPEDWNAIPLGELGEALIGLTYRPSDVKEHGILVLRSSNIQEGHLAFADNVYVDCQIPERIRVQNGDILICVRNGSRPLIGKCALLDERVVGETFGAFMGVFRTKNSSYVFYQFQSDVVQRQIREHIGATINQITNKNLNSFIIPFPKNPNEEHLIASTLSDIDSLIVLLDKLIAKKRAIKQGAMQELLTGKRRLSGFSGTWKRKKLGEICGKITTGKLDANAMVEDGEYRFYTCAKEYYWIDQYAFDTEALLVSGNGANVGYVHHYKGKFNAYQRTYVLYDFSENISYVKLFMDKKLQNRIRTEVNAGNTPYIKMDTLAEMEIQTPPTIDEQNAIVEMLHAMDTEIDKMLQKLNKLRMLKQGMMQVLLTGKVRLV